jgi:eukaryotic-like serine/threonine-protein kinase
VPGLPVHIGQVISGRYRVDQLVGQGGTALVFAATHVGLGAPVAVKVLRPEVAREPDFCARLLREGRLAVRVRSPHAARVLDVGVLPAGSPYLVLERSDGQTLDEVLRRLGRVPPCVAAYLVVQACDAVGEAHALGIVHRDLKPANLLLSRSARGDFVVKVLDFGLARSISGLEPSITRSDVVCGSPSYMAPEQLRSPRAVDARADVWSLGVILFEAVAGRLPFDGATLAELAYQVTRQPPPPLGGVARGFAAVIERCLAKDAAERHAGARELAAALALFLGSC